MPTEQEIKDFAYFNKYGKMPTKKTKSNEGKLWYDGFLQYKKKELINRGFTPSKFRITY